MLTHKHFANDSLARVNFLLINTVNTITYIHAYEFYSVYVSV